MALLGLEPERLYSFLFWDEFVLGQGAATGVGRTVFRGGEMRAVTALCFALTGSSEFVFRRNSKSTEVRNVKTSTLEC